jgi:CRP/FNR family transcriptional regulator, cyclic AMP receptor protein
MSAPHLDLSLPQPLALPPPKAAYEGYPFVLLGKGDSLYRAGDEAESVFRVERGLLKQGFDLISGRERILGLAGPGDFLGALGPDASYAESVTALSPDVRLAVIAREYLEFDPRLKDDVFAATGLQLRRMQELLEDGELPLPARLARLLLRLGARFGQTAEGGRVLLKLPLTHETLAAMVGAARESTTAALGEMRALGVLCGTRGQYSFALRGLSEFALEHALY